MKAVYFTEPGIENLKIEDIKEPENGLKIKIIKAGLNPLDYNLIEGNIVYNVNPMPHIPGSEVLGIAMEDGNTIKKGDKVIVYNRIFDNNCDMCFSGNEHLCYNGGIWGVVTNGGYSEYVSIGEGNLFKVPENLDDNTSVSIGIGALTSYRALKRAGSSMGKKILIYGMGNTGIFTAQLAKYMGLDVYALSRKTMPYINTFKEIPNDFKADIIINPLGGELFSDSLKHIKRKGKIVTYGVLNGRFSNIDIANIYTNEIEIYGSTGGSRLDLFELLTIMGTRKFTLPVYKEYSLWDIKEALNDFKNRETGRIIFNL